LQLRNPVVACIGLGGVGYQSTTLVAPLIKRLGIEEVLVFDPDYIEAGNLRRQYRECDEGKPKEKAFLELVSGPECLKDFDPEEVGPFNVDKGDLAILQDPDMDMEGCDLILLCWPDNMQCRLDAAIFAVKASKEGNGRRVILITGGCTIDGADAMALVVDDGEVLWEFRTLEFYEKLDALEEERDEEATPGCDTQTSLSNAMCAAMGFNLLEYIMGDWKEGDPNVTLYWDADSRKGPRMYAKFATIRGKPCEAPGGGSLVGV
jgi:molybdopterin/thiamine biosynthesis adenylyltransferase